MPLSLAMSKSSYCISVSMASLVGIIGANSYQVSKIAERHNMFVVASPICGKNDAIEQMIIDSRCNIFNKGTYLSPTPYSYPMGDTTRVVVDEFYDFVDYLFSLVECDVKNVTMVTMEELDFILEELYAGL